MIDKYTSHKTRIFSPTYRRGGILRGDVDELVNTNEYCPDYLYKPQYKLLPWEYYGYVIGTKDLYECFKNITGHYHVTECSWTDSFKYDPNAHEQEIISYDIEMTVDQTPVSFKI